MGCTTIITNKGGLIETTKNPIILKNLDPKNCIKLLKIILNHKIEKRLKINYNSFFLLMNCYKYY